MAPGIRDVVRAERQRKVVAHLVRRIAEERRRDVAERERDATARLSEQLVQAQAAVERRLGDWSADLEKLQEDQHQWQDAYITRQRLAQIAGPPDQPKSQLILAFLENERGPKALKDGRSSDAVRRF